MDRVFLIILLILPVSAIKSRDSKKLTMEFEISDSNILLSWAVTTFLGWIITAAGYFIFLTPSVVLIGWAVLMLIPVAVTVRKYYSGNSNKLFNAWAIIVSILMLQNFAVNQFLVFSYFTLWMIAGAVAYFYTSKKLPPPSDRTYLYASGLNLAATPLIYLIPLRYFALLAALVQAGPIFYDYWEVHW